MAVMLVENALVACNVCTLCVCCCLDEYFCAKAEEELQSGAAVTLVRKLRAAALRRMLRAAREDMVVVEGGMKSREKVFGYSMGL